MYVRVERAFGGLHPVGWWVALDDRYHIFQPASLVYTAVTEMQEWQEVLGTQTVFKVVLVTFASVP